MTRLGLRRLRVRGEPCTNAPLILAAMLQRFDFEIPQRTQLTFSPRISLRAKGTVPLRVCLLGQ